jgi:hypothetical protein
LVRQPVPRIEINLGQMLGEWSLPAAYEPGGRRVLD